jgi:hypothetical protein
MSQHTTQRLKLRDNLRIIRAELDQLPADERRVAHAIVLTEVAMPALLEMSPSERSRFLRPLSIPGFPNARPLWRRPVLLLVMLAWGVLAGLGTLTLLGLIVAWIMRDF